MNEKEMIEEMAKDLKECLPNNWYWQKSVDSDTYLVAKHFYNAGYRKIPEGAVVLSKEQNKKWLKCLEQNIKKARKETLKKIKLTPIECREECGHYYFDISVTGKELLQRVYFTSSFIDVEIRKETAKEIIEEIKSLLFPEEGGLLAWLDAIAKEYGVEVER